MSSLLSFPFSFSGIQSSSLHVRYVPGFSLSKLTKEVLRLIITLLSDSSIDLSFPDIISFTYSFELGLLLDARFCLELKFRFLIFTTVFDFDLAFLSNLAKELVGLMKCFFLSACVFLRCAIELNLSILSAVLFKVLSFVSEVSLRWLCLEYE